MMHYLNHTSAIALAAGEVFLPPNYKVYFQFKKGVFGYCLALSTHLIMLVIMRPVQELDPIMFMYLLKTIT